MQLSSPTVSPWKIRSVQLDLARQMETLEFIRGFINFIADNGYNSLVLYLEGRIRTESFPFPDISESYTPDQMRDVVRHAAERGIEIIPAVASFGHAEHFLRHPGLEHLAENRPPFLGRFGPTVRNTFCPSQPETLRFLEAYLSEIAAIFPSMYFHAGCDEIWSMGCCDLCRRRLDQGETQGDLFAGHIRNLHEIVTGKLGRRMIIWDDMFECYPETLPEIPRDVIMACWQYQGNVGLPRAHFLNRAVRDALAEYDRLGFEYLICPADYTLRNAESFTRYAARHRPLGGLLTSWSNRECLVLQSMPLIATVGRSWNGADWHEAMEAVCRDVFGIEDPRFVSAIKSVCVSGRYRERSAKVTEYLSTGENKPDFGRTCLVEVLLATLPGFAGVVRETARPMLEEIILSLQSESIRDQLVDLLPQFFRNDRNEHAEIELEAICEQLETIAEKRNVMWDSLRPGIEPRRPELLYKAYLANLREVPELARLHGLLTIHFFLPDQYSAQNVRILIRYTDAAQWETVAKGVFKEPLHFDCFYARSFLIDKARTPQALKIETSGFGGQGFTYFVAENSAGRYIPNAVENVEGTVTDADNLLTHDWQWTFTGERNTAKNYFDTEGAVARHGFEIALRKS